MRRLATIDIGTNTALLLVADVADGTFEVVHEADRFVRLGEGVDATGAVAPQALQRLRDALQAHAADARAHGAQHVVVAGTSASRDAANRDELERVVRDATGASYEILSGDDEARWSFAGAVSALPPGAYAVVDVGGGSTELVAGRRGESGAIAIDYRVSLDVGSVRMTERHFSSLPPTPAETASARAWARALLETAAPPLDGLPLVGAAGTAVALALVDAGAEAWGEDGGPRELTAERVHGWAERLLGLGRDAVFELNPAIMAGRADVFAAGVLVLSEVVRRTGAERLLVSPRGLRHGLALRAAAQRGEHGT